VGLSREQIGEVLVKLRAAGRSLACLEQIRCPLTRFYQWQTNAKGYKGPDPAADLKFFLGVNPASDPESEICSGSAKTKHDAS
jgi:hypothetical protein